MTEIVSTKIGIIIYLFPTGPLTDEEGPAALASKVETCLKSREINIVLDLGNVPTLTGAIIEALLDIQDKLVRFGGGLKVTNANSLIKDIFLITGFNDYVAVL